MFNEACPEPQFQTIYLAQHWVLFGTTTSLCGMIKGQGKITHQKLTENEDHLPSSPHATKNDEDEYDNNYDTTQ